MKKHLLAIALTASMSVTAFADTQEVKNALEQQQLELAESAFVALTKNEKQSIEGQILAGRIMLAKDESEQAFEYFEQLQQQHPNDVDSNYYLGVSAVIMAQKASIFSKLGYAKDFLAAMEKTIALQPTHVDALTTLIGFHLAAPGIAGGDKDKALAYAQQLKTVDEEQGYEQLANVYWQTDKKALAEQTFEQGLQLYPQSAPLYLSRASLHIKEENWQQARADLTQAIKFAKTDKQKGRALYQQGKVSAESGTETNLGIEVLNQALPLADETYQPWVEYRLAQLYIQNQSLAKAKQLLTQVEVGDDDELKTKVKKLKKKLKKMMG